MVLKTKCIKAPVERDDGLRICIMRIYEPKKHSDYEYVDTHWKDLAPSKELLKEFHNRLSWQDYVERFTKEVLGPQAKMIRDLAQLAMKKNVTILCYEKTPEKCHRSLIADECKRYERGLEVILQ